MPAGDPGHGVTRVHLDTDLGSDTDDLCALAMLLGWPEVELAGVTTCTDPGGRRAGFTEYALALAGRRDVPVVAGAEGSLGGLALSPIVIPEYWPEPISPRPARAGAAVELLEASVQRGATVVAIGPYTNLAMLEAVRPGLLASTRVVVMGGHVPRPREGLPQWGVHEDFNVQQDRLAALTVLQRCEPVVVPLAATVEVWMRAAHLEPLRGGGPLGRLLADQAEGHARDNGMAELARSFPDLPDDLLNFQHDPLACATALGWDGVTVELLPMDLELRAERLWMVERPDGRPLDVVTGVDSEGFERLWLDAATRASSAGSA
jgi:purine nucleosidase